MTAKCASVAFLSEKTLKTHSSRPSKPRVPPSTPSHVPFWTCRAALQSPRAHVKGIFDLPLERADRPSPPAGNAAPSRAFSALPLPESQRPCAGTCIYEPSTLDDTTEYKQRDSQTCVSHRTPRYDPRVDRGRLLESAETGDRQVARTHESHSGASRSRDQSKFRGHSFHAF